MQLPQVYSCYDPAATVSPERLATFKFPVANHSAYSVYLGVPDPICPHASTPSVISLAFQFNAPENRSTVPLYIA